MVFNDVYSHRIEKVLESHGKIYEAACLYYEASGGKKIPFVIVRAYSELNEKKLLAFCHEKLGEESPERIFFIKDFSYDSSGKILKDELLEKIKPRLKYHQNRLEPINTSIPKIIHQSYHIKELPDPRLEENIEHIKKINPTWEHRFYDENERIEFIANNYGSDILNAYYKINPLYGSVRADLFRHLLIYSVGGVWLDIKSTIDQNLDISLREDDAFILSQWHNKMGEPLQGRGLYKELAHIPGGEFEVWHVISARGNPCIKAAIEKIISNIYNYTPNKFGVGFWGALRTAGPIAYTLAVAPLLKTHKHRFVDIERDMKFRWTIYSDRYEHRKHSKIHYSQLKEPVILP